jgi:hypothetical protein
VSDDSAGPGSSGRPGAARRLFFDDLAGDPDAPPVDPAAPTAATRPSPTSSPGPTSGPPRPEPARSAESPRRLVFDDLAHEGEPDGGDPADDLDTVRGGGPVLPPTPRGTPDSRRRLVGAAAGVIAVVIIAVVAVALVGRNAHSSRTTAAGHPASKAASRTATGTHAAAPKHARRNAPAPTKAAVPAPARVPLTVLNNTTVTGLARTAAQDFKAHGWSVDQVANYTGRLAATTVFYRDGDAAAQRAARALARQFPEIAQVAPRSPALPAGNGLTVVLAPDWTTS